MIEPAYGLHDYPRQVFRDIIDILTAPQELVSPGVRVLAHLPTGSGKTRIAARVASKLLGLHDNPDALVVWAGVRRGVVITGSQRTGKGVASPWK